MIYSFVPILYWWFLVFLVRTTYSFQQPITFKFSKSDHTNMSHELYDKFSTRNSSRGDPELFSRLFSRLFSAEAKRDWRDTLRRVTGELASQYAVAVSSSARAPKDCLKKWRKRGNTIPAPSSLRQTNQQYLRQLWMSPPAPVEQFPAFPASWDMSRKYMLYQPQFLVNGSVYIDKSSEPRTASIFSPPNAINETNIYYI